MQIFGYVECQNAEFRNAECHYTERHKPRR
jgi:hypothetical protein